MKGGFWGGIVLGALVGAAAALLFAPAKGEDTREKLKDDIERIKKQMEEKKRKLEEMEKEFAKQ